jgi:hypothetical protein
VGDDGDGYVGYGIPTLVDRHTETEGSSDEDEENEVEVVNKVEGELDLMNGEGREEGNVRIDCDSLYSYDHNLLEIFKVIGEEAEIGFMGANSSIDRAKSSPCKIDCGDLEEFNTN